MKILIESDLYEGSPSQIIEQLRENSFDKQAFPSLEQYIDYMCENFERFTEMPANLLNMDLNERARAIIMKLAEIDALEVVDSE